MMYPDFDSDGDPTEETLAAIAAWQPDFNASESSWATLLTFVRDAWNLDYGAIREEIDANGQPLLCLATGVWSADESLQGALASNKLFHLLRWHSSYRGGLTKYLLRGDAA